MKAETDKDILEASIKNPHLFSILVERYQNAFLRKSRSVLHSDEMIEDIVQDTFLKIYKNASHFKEHPNASFSSWAYKILINTCYTYYAKRKKEAVLSLDEEFDQHRISDVIFAESKLDDEVHQENKALIEKILSQIPFAFSRILRLYFLEEKSQKEIARTENISLEAVRTRVHRAKKYFRDISTKII